MSSALGDEAVILELSAGVYYGLNEVGATVWWLLRDRTRTVGELRDAVVERYAVDADTALSDLVRLVEELAARGLVDVAAPVDR